MSLERTNIKRGWALISGAAGMTANDGGCIASVARTGGVGAGSYTIVLSPEQDANYTSARVQVRGGAAGAAAKIASWSDAAIVVETYIIHTATLTDEAFEIEVLTTRAY